jgi:hypothetical protein
MDFTDCVGLAIFMGTFTAMSIFVCSAMERHLRRVDRVIHQVEQDNAKYIN